MQVCFVVNKLSFFLSHRLDLAQAISLTHDFVLITDLQNSSDQDKRAIQELKINAVHLNQRSKKIGWMDWLRYSMELRGLLHKISPTHVFYITLELSMLGIILHNFIGGKKSFFVISGLTNHLTSKSLKMLMRRQIHRIFNLLLYVQKKHLFIFQNNDDRRLFLKKNMAFKRNTKVIRGNGVNPLVFYSAERPKNTSLVFLFSSRLLLSKGIKEFIEASKILQIKYPQTIFQVAGCYDPGDAESISKEEFDTLILDTDYLGEIEHTNMPKILAEVSVFVLPSYGEGLPKAALEAGLMGLPLIVADVPGCRDCINGQENGFLVEPRNITDLSEKMEILILDHELRSKQGKNARDYILENFSNEVIHDEYIELINT